MTGAESLIRTLLACGIDTCFTNPGTSEMHMVAALDANPGMRPVLALFEGVVTGAADGYARLSGRPAATVLHLGPGLANGLANLHNARKASSPILNVVGEHALYHLEYDAPLTSDIAGFARPVSSWIGRADSADLVAGQAATAAAAAISGKIATLMMPADSAWGTVSNNSAQPEIKVMNVAPNEDAAALNAAIDALRTYGDQALLLLGSTALLDDSACWAQAVAQATGCRVAAQSLSARMTRGADLPPISRIPFEIDAALRYLAPVRCLVRIGAPSPVGFFAYQGKPSQLLPDGCKVIDAAPDASDPRLVLQALAQALKVLPVRVSLVARMADPAGALDTKSIAAAIAATLPDDAVVIDESITAGQFIFPMTASAARHDWLNNMGGAIGFGLPVAIGAAIARPDRRVFAMVGDGSAFYTEQALWTLARENLNVTVLIFANRAYAVLRNEWQRMKGGLAPGPRARDMLTLERPTPDWVAIARGHGVDAVRVDDAAALAKALRDGFNSSGPRLIEAVY